MPLWKAAHLLTVMLCLSVLECFSLVHFRTEVESFHNPYGTLNNAWFYKMLLITSLILRFSDLVRSKNPGKIYDSSYPCYMQTLVSY